MFELFLPSEVLIWGWELLLVVDKSSHVDTEVGWSMLAGHVGVSVSIYVTHTHIPFANAHSHTLLSTAHTLSTCTHMLTILSLSLSLTHTHTHTHTQQSLSLLPNRIHWVACTMPFPQSSGADKTQHSQTVSCSCLSATPPSLSTTNLGLT